MGSDLCFLSGIQNEPPSWVEALRTEGRTASQTYISFAIKIGGWVMQNRKKAPFQTSQGFSCFLEKTMSSWTRVRLTYHPFPILFFSLAGFQSGSSFTCVLNTAGKIKSIRFSSFDGHDFLVAPNAPPRKSAWTVTKQKCQKSLSKTLGTVAPSQGFCSLSWFKET